MYSRPRFFSSILNTFSLTVEEVVPAVSHDQPDTEEVVGGFEATSGDVALRWLLVCEIRGETVSWSGGPYTGRHRSLLWEGDPAASCWC